MAKKGKQDVAACPCGGMVPGTGYAACCQPYIDGVAAAPTAEHLMRSRYTAYAIGNAGYVLSTWHVSTRPSELVLEAAGTPHAMRWLGLTVHSSVQLSDDRAQVMFTARYREGGRAHRLREHSRFALEDGCWFYVDGEVDSGEPS